MGTIKQHLKTMIKRFKIDIKRCNGKLLVAAVILFGISGALITPAKGVEQFLVWQLSENKSMIVEQVQDTTFCPAEDFVTDQNYLTANVLASLISPPDLSGDSSQDTFLDSTGLATFQENALLNQTNPITFISQEARDDIITYIVQEGDTSSNIAASFGITVNTLLWANQLKETSIIRPGDELDILPITGLLYRIKDGDTIGSIAKKYEAEAQDILAFNDLSADGTIQVNEKIVIPDGQMPIPVQVRSAYIASRSYTTGPGTGKSRSFPYGQCTWYVAQKRYVPWSGHAKYWLGNARAYGYQTGSTPQAGAIMVMTEGGWLGRVYGHVAYVESVQGNWVTISEMNYNCYGCKSVRTIKIGDYRIRGYIY